MVPENSWRRFAVAQTPAFEGEDLAHGFHDDAHDAAACSFLFAGAWGSCFWGAQFVEAVTIVGAQNRAFDREPAA